MAFHTLEKIKKKILTEDHCEILTRISSSLQNYMGFLVYIQVVSGRSQPFLGN